MVAGTNLSVGQSYVLYLAQHAAVGGDLIRLLASYNAGPTSFERMCDHIPPSDDPLLFIESIPNQETRGFVPRALAYTMLIQAVRFKLPTKLKKTFDSEFKEILAAPVVPNIATMWIAIAAATNVVGKKYYGQKTHEKQITAYLQKGLKAPFTEEQWESMCVQLGVLGKPRLWEDALKKARKAYPKNPIFHLTFAQMELARRFYYDATVFDRRAVRYLVDLFGADRLLVGSDYPAMPREDPAAATVRSVELTPDQLEDITWRNAHPLPGGG